MVPILSALALVVLLGMVVSRVWTDWLWFSELRQAQVFSTRLVAGIMLFIVFGGLMAAAVLGNLVLAARMRPRTRPVATSTLVNRDRKSVV